MIFLLTKPCSVDEKTMWPGDIPSYIANPPDKPPTRPPLARAACRAGPGDQLHYVWKKYEKIGTYRMGPPVELAFSFRTEK
jgi:hypothetical protein